MFTSLLVANRGEIACRVMATARRLGMRTIAVYSDADESARHVRLADEAVRIGPAAAKESYLVVEKIIEAAKKTGAEAIHPGYGFLSENPALPDACVAAGIVFVGPSAASIRAMGSKSAAKAIMDRAQVPLTPGYYGDDQDPAHLAKEAERIGYPVLIKASWGGGGKGMRRVDRSPDFDAALASCKREAISAFGSDQVLIERYVERPRHIEVQVFGDTHGNYVHLFERDCSVQRRHQKVLEEAPAPGMTEERRGQMGKAAILAAKAVDYVGAGTVEFIADPSGAFFFMEMNTRLQVEHPVTEKITGLDLVEWQLRVASGEPLPLAQDQLHIHGHALEARIYAENPDTGFLPQAGRLVHLDMPQASQNVRIDSGVEQGDSVTPFYDPMIAKLIVWGQDRAEALGHMRAALEQVRIVGLENNVELLGRLVRTKAFATADLDTSLIEREHAALFPEKADPPDEAWRIAAIAEMTRHTPVDASPWSMNDGFRLGHSVDYATTLKHGETKREILTRHGARFSHAHVVRTGPRLHVFFGGHRYDFDVIDPLFVDTSGTEAAGGLRAPMPGKVIAHLVEVGATVKKGTPVLVLESMKMELSINAPRAGKVERFRFAPGEQVPEGAELVVLSDGDA